MRTRLRLLVNREPETKGPHSSVSESLFQNCLNPGFQSGHRRILSVQGDGFCGKSLFQNSVTGNKLDMLSLFSQKSGSLGVSNGFTQKIWMKMILMAMRMK
ncbi:hypothetical protein LXL04_007819 [Taraxacum kok-saghyz]